MSRFHPSHIERLKARAALTRRLRTFFDDEGFWEVDTPLWSRETCVDAWIDPVACVLPGFGDGFLQTSPEFHLKRLLAGGADSVWQLTRSFRGGEAGPMHNPEFAIVEWYRVGEDHHDAMSRTERLIRACELPSLPSAPLPRLSYFDLMNAACGSPVAHLDADGLAEIASELGTTISGPLDRDGWLNVLLAEHVEPTLAERGAVFVTDYPASQSALAKVRTDSDPPVADRFELYVDGVELANGYHELTDADELERRFERQNAIRRAAGADPLPIGRSLLDAMAAGLPDCAGVAVGWDRVVMLAMGLSDVRDVMSFPVDTA